MSTRTPWISLSSARRKRRPVPEFCSFTHNKGGYRMKISDVKTFVVGTPWRNLTFVRVLTDEGLSGVGEVRMLNHTDALLGYFSEAVPITSWATIPSISSTLFRA